MKWPELVLVVMAAGAVGLGIATLGKDKQVLVLGAVGLSLAGALWLLKRHRVRRFPVWSEAEVRAWAQRQGIPGEDLVHGRDLLARMLQVPSSRLSPEATIRELAQHLESFGDVGMALEECVELAWTEGHVEPEDVRSWKVGELAVALARRNAQG